MRHRIVLLAAGLTTLAVAAPASAATYCVGDRECPADGVVKPDVASAAAAATADDGADLIRVGTGTFDLGATPLKLRGGDMLQGTGSTLTGTLDLAGTPTVKTLTLRLPAGAGTGVAAAGGRLEDVEIDGEAVTGPDAIGVSGTGVTELRRVEVALGAGTGLSGAVRAEDTTVIAPTGATLAAGATLRRVLVESGTGVLAPAGGVELDAVAVRLAGADATGVSVGPPSAGAVPTTLTHVTVLGDGQLGSRGLVLRSGCAGAANMVDVSQSAIGGVATSIDRGGTCAEGEAAAASLTVEDSAYEPTTVASSGPGEATLEPPLTTDLRLDDQLVPLPDSPLVDAGDPSEPAGLDVAGEPRPTDGNGDGFAAPDVGAAELAQQPLTDDFGLGDPPYDTEYSYDDDYYTEDDEATTRKRRPTSLRVGVTRDRAKARRYTVTVRLGYPRRTSPRNGVVTLDAWARKRHLGKRRAKLDRRGRARFVVRVPRGVAPAKVGLQAAFRGTSTLTRRTSRWVGLS